MEAASVHVKVDVALLEVRGDCLPNLDLRRLRFHRLPGGLANALAVDLRQNEKQLQLAVGRLFVYSQDNAAHLLPVEYDPVSLGILPVDGIFDGLTGDDLIAFLATLIPRPELLLGRTGRSRPMTTSPMPAGTSSTSSTCLTTNPRKSGRAISRMPPSCVAGSCSLPSWPPTWKASSIKEKNKP